MEMGIAVKHVKKSHRMENVKMPRPKPTTSKGVRFLGGSAKEA